MDRITDIICYIQFWQFIYSLCINSTSLANYFETHFGLQCSDVIHYIACLVYSYLRTRPKNIITFFLDYQLSNVLISVELIVTFISCTIIMTSKRG